MSAAGITACANADAALIAACAEFDLLHQATGPFDPEDDEGFARLLDRRRDAADEAVAICPTTKQGIAEQARIALTLVEENGEPGSHTHQIVVAVLQHLIGGAA